MSAVKILTVSAVLLSVICLSMMGCKKEEQPETEPASATQTEIAQKTCPVMGGAIDPSIYVDHEGRRVYFCCPACVDKFKKDPEKYLKKLDEQLQAPAKEPDAPPSR